MAALGSRVGRWGGVFLLLSCILAFGQYQEPETALKIADVAVSQGRFDVARASYERVLRSNPRISADPERCRSIAEAFIRSTNPNLKIGADWLQRAVVQEPNNDATRQRLADTLLRASDSFRAANQYRILLAKDAGNPQYVLGLATALRNLGQFEEAASLLSSNLNEHPGENALRVEYARTLSYQRRFEASRAQYEQVLNSDLENQAAQIGLAKVLSWQGDQAGALVRYDKVLQKDPGNYDAIVGEAFSLIWVGRQSEALPLLTRANSRHPEDMDVRDALRRLGAAVILTGEVRAGDPTLPIVPPTVKKPGKSAVLAGAEMKREAAVPAQEPTSQPPASAETKARGRHPILFASALGVTILIAVFAIVLGLPWLRAEVKKHKWARRHPTYVEKSPESWTRLEEYARVISQEHSPALPSVAELPPSPAGPIQSILFTRPARPRRRQYDVAERPWWPHRASDLIEQDAAAEKLKLEGETPIGEGVNTDNVVSLPVPEPLAPPEPGAVLSKPAEDFSDSAASQEIAVPFTWEVEQSSDAAAFEMENLRALQGCSAVIVGCGVMVSHYRSVLRMAGTEVRTFTFWDLALNSMRERRADVLLIDGESLDGLTPSEMYRYAMLERYICGIALVGIGADDDRSILPDNVVLAHSLPDSDLTARLAESLRAS